MTGAVLGYTKSRSVVAFVFELLLDCTKFHSTRNQSTPRYADGFNLMLLKWNFMTGWVVKFNSALLRACSIFYCYDSLKRKNGAKQEQRRVFDGIKSFSFPIDWSSNEIVKLTWHWSTRIQFYWLLENREVIFKHQLSGLLQSGLRGWLTIWLKFVREVVQLDAFRIEWYSLTLKTARWRFLFKKFEVEVGSVT